MAVLCKHGLLALWNGRCYSAVLGPANSSRDGTGTSHGERLSWHNLRFASIIAPLRLGIWPGGLNQLPDVRRTETDANKERGERRSVFRGQFFSGAAFTARC